MNNRKNLLPICNKQKGSTLIEVLIALLVFTIGLQGIRFHAIPVGKR